MGKNPKEQTDKFLSKTQEVLYQREFKQANKVYEQATKGRRS